MIARATLLVLVLIAAGGHSPADSREPPPQAPQVPTQQNPESRLKSQYQATEKETVAGQPAAGKPQAAPETAEPKPNKNPGETRDESAEFYVLRGVKLKISDWALISISFLTFLANVALIVATWYLVKGAEDTAEKQLRAYMNIDTVVRFLDSAAPTIFFADIVFVNNGQTPAYNVDADRAFIVIREFPLQTPLVQLVQTDVRPKSILGPRVTGTKRMMLFEPITPNDEAAILAGTKAVYVWGEIRYDDIFERPRFVRFNTASEGIAYRLGRFHEGGDDETAN